MREPRREHHIPPAVGEDSQGLLQGAGESLAKLRGLEWLDDAGARLHLLASLSAEAQRQLLRAVEDARRHGFSWGEIADLLGVTRASAWQRYARSITDDPSARVPR